MCGLPSPELSAHVDRCAEFTLEVEPTFARTVAVRILVARAFILTRVPSRARVRVGIVRFDVRVPATVGVRTVRRTGRVHIVQCQAVMTERT